MEPALQRYDWVQSGIIQRQVNSISIYSPFLGGPGVGLSSHPLITKWVSFAGNQPLSLGCVCVCELLNSVQLFATPWMVARQAPLSMEFSRQEYWSRLPFPSPGDFPDPERFFTTWTTREALVLLGNFQKSPYVYITKDTSPILSFRKFNQEF